MHNSTILENNICVVTESLPDVRSIAMGFLIDAGPRNENPKQSGLAHLVEHVMFSGTSSRNANQIARFMDEAGGSMGAFTTRDYTCFSATVLDDYHPYALDLMGDVLLNSIFPARKVDSEIAAVMREIDAAHDRPDVRVHDLLKKSIWPEHPLGRPITGTPDTVKKLSREDIIYFVHEHYLPDRIIIAATGNLEHEDFVAQVRDCFWRMLGQSQPEPESGSEFKSCVRIDHMPVSQVYFSFGIPALPYADRERYSMHIMNKVLGGGISSRLYRKMREECGLVYEIGSEYHAYRDAGLWVIEGSTAPESIIQVLGLTLVEIGKLINGVEPVEEEELWKAKMQIRGQHLIAGENTHTCMGRLATQEYYFGRKIPDHEIIDRIEAIDARRLEKFAESNLKTAMQQISIAVVGPEADDLYSQAAIESMLSDIGIGY